MSKGGGYSTHVNGNWMSVQDLDTVCDNLKYLFDEQQRENDRLQEALKTIKDDKWKDETLQKMKVDMEAAKKAMWRGFPMTEEEATSVRKWQKEHDTIIHKNPSQYHGCSGGGYIYHFFPTAIGTSGVCVCASCYAQAMKDAGGDNKKFKALLDEYNAEFEFQELG